MSDRFLKMLRHADLSIACVAIAALVLVTVLGVVMRYVVGSPLTWLEEVQMALIVWVTMLGGSAAFREYGHVAVDALFSSSGAKVQTALRWIITLVSLALLGFLAWNGIKFMLFQHSANRVTDILRIPYALIYSAVPLGAGLMIINYVLSEVRPLLRGESVH